MAEKDSLRGASTGSTAATVDRQHHERCGAHAGTEGDGEFKLEPFIRPLFQTIERIGSDKLKDEYLYTHYHLNHEDLKNLGYKTNDYLEYQMNLIPRRIQACLKLSSKRRRMDLVKKISEILSKHMLKCTAYQ